MAILITPEKRVIMHGIAGREGNPRTRLMKGYYTQVVGGITPGKGGTIIEGMQYLATFISPGDES